jgi:hypothetical protein
MGSEVNESVAYDNYDNYSQNFNLLFWGLFNDESDLRVRVIPNLVGLRVPKVSEENKVMQ